MIKCPNCGSQMGLEDKFCPYCGSPNTQAVQHQRDMEQFQDDYSETKEHVYRRTEVLRNQGSLLIMMVLILIAMIIAIILNARAWDIGYKIREKNVARYSATDTDIVEQYLEAGEYGKFTGYFDSNDMYYDYDGTYDAVKSAARSYVRLFEYVNDIQDPSSYLFREDAGSGGFEYLAENLMRIYTVEKDYSYNKEKVLTEDKLVYIHDIQERAGVMAKAYFGLTDEDVQEIPNMSAGKLEALLEERIKG